MAPEAPVRAAGAVLWREDRGLLEVALVHRPRYDDWSFPKGKAKQNEHLLRTAVREVREETGVTPRLGVPLPAASYTVNGRYKRVEYWAAEIAGETPFAPDREVDELAWLPAHVALGRLTHEHDALLLRTFAELPRRTRPVVVLRHASAGEKRFWHGDDLLRPLDARGRWEAGELIPLLAAYRPGRLVSSTAARCVETVLGYSAARNVPITTDLAFTVGSRQCGSAAPRLRELLAVMGDGLLVSTHGELVPDLVETICADDKAPDDPFLRKGSFWVFHLTPTGEVTALERHAPRD